MQSLRALPSSEINLEAIEGDEEEARPRKKKRT